MSEQQASTPERIFRLKQLYLEFHEWASSKPPGLSSLVAERLVEFCDLSLDLGGQAELWRLVATRNDTKLRDLVKEGPTEMHLAGLATVAAECRNLLLEHPEAENYITLKFRDDIGEIEVTVRRGDKATPSDLKEKADRERDETAERGVRLEVERDTWRDRCRVLEQALCAEVGEERFGHLKSVLDGIAEKAGVMS